MRRFLVPLALLALLLLAGPAAVDARCNMPGPAYRPVGAPQTKPPPDRPPELPGDNDPATPTPGPGVLPTPRNGSGSGPISPTGPSVGRIGTERSPGTKRPRGVSYAASWRIWWELNREHLLGLRKTLARLEPRSGTAAAPVDLRDQVREGLRRAAETSTDEELRGAALRALGRVGNEEDARFLLQVLRRTNLPDPVTEGAAIGLASLKEIRTEPIRAGIRTIMNEVAAGRHGRSSQNRLITLLALSLRGRDDPAITRRLALACATDAGDPEEAAAVLFACGLTRDPFLAEEVLNAARTGRLAGGKLHDVARSHAILAVAMTGEARAGPALAAVLTDEDSRAHTRRSAALALGILLREERVMPEDRQELERTMLRALEKDRDPLVKGYLLLAMGQARPMIAPDVLMKTVDRTGDAVTKPYAALALGLAARNLAEAKAAPYRTFLASRLEKARDVELGAALSLAAGLATADEARATLLARAGDPHLNPSLRGPALEGLGLYGQPTDPLDEILVAALDEASPEVVQDACIALGMLGRTTAARLLVEKLRTTKDDMVRVHMVIALSHLGGTTTTPPLLEILGNAKLKPGIRESAAEALGILADPREEDPLFEIDACCNPYGTTIATRRLVWVY